MKKYRLPEGVWTYIILLYLFLIYLPLIISKSDGTENFIQGDSYYYRAVIDSLLDDGDLLLVNNFPTDPLNGQLAIGRGGLVPKHPVIMALFSLPFYFLFGTPGLLLFNILGCVILMLLIFKLNCLIHNSLISFVTTILYATASLFLDYTYNYSPDIFSTVLLVGSLYLILREKFYSGALLLGLSIFAKLPNAPLAAVLLLYAGIVIWRGKSKSDSAGDSFKNKLTVSVTAAVIFVVALLPFAYTNYQLFGSPVVTGYQRTAVADAYGQMQLVNHAGKFNQPLLKGIYLSLFEPRHGVIPTNPVILLAFLGIVQIKRSREKEKIYLILLISLIQFLLFAKYDEWNMSHFSNRFLMTFIALSSVFTSHYLSYLAEKFSLEASLFYRTS